MRPSFPARSLALFCAAALCLEALSPGALAQAGDDPPRTGEQLLGELACSACHTALPHVEARLQSKRAPLLDAVGARLSPAWIERYLLEPHAAKPGATMPDVLGSLQPEARGAAAEALTHFLVGLGGPIDLEPTAARPAELERGRRLYHELGCVACHAPQEEDWELEVDFETARAERIADEAEPEVEEDFEEEEEDDLDPGPPEVDVPLGDLERKWSVPTLATFLVDPLASRPSGRMPSMNLDQGEARAIAIYLLRGQALSEEGGVERFAGLEFDYYEQDFRSPAPDFDAHVPVGSGVVATLSGLPEHRPDHFGFRFRGELSVEAPGNYTFYTTSDDGSRLYVDGALVVENDGDHAPRERSGQVELATGWHTLEVTMYENAGGEELAVHWEGPGIPNAELPAERLTHGALACRPVGATEFEVDPERAALGAAWFRSLRCDACHGAPAALPEVDVPPPTQALAALDPAAAGGCLAKRPAPAAPRYALSDDERRALRAALADPLALTEEIDAAAELDRALARFRCTACHSRDGAGGPAYARRPYFKERGHWDLGDQGRIPPHLDEPGSKLTPRWLSEVLFDGGSSRPYVATRMPQFGEGNLARLPELFHLVDAKPDDHTAPRFDPADVEHGRVLAGRNGLGCIQCHEFAGFPSLGIPAVDLAYVRDRVQPGWFRRLLRDPVGINMNTRMPEFWVQGESPVADVHEGDIDLQIDALWTYLSLGPAMPMPDGLVVPDEEFELLVGDVPRTVGVFMQGVSPRTLCVGFPEGTHYAWDVQGSRLAKAWRGRFFNARGTWEARAGQLERPPSEDVLDLLPGPLLARLGDPSAPWPRSNEEVEGYRVLGRRFDAERRPVFRYAIGGVQVEELLYPEIREGGTWIVRAVTLRSSEPADDLFVRGSSPGSVVGVRLGGGSLVRYEAELPDRAGDAGVFRVALTLNADGDYVARIEEQFTW